MRLRAIAATIGLSVLVVALIFPVAGVASPIGRPGQGVGPSGGWAWPAGWSGSCGAAGSGGVGAAAACSAIQLDNPAAWQGHHLGPARSPGRGSPPAPTTPSGYAPVELEQAYGLTTASAAGGTGETVAIVDAYDDPYALSNLSTYRAEWGLEPVCGGSVVTGCVTFTKVNQNGQQRPLPSGNTSWSEEISLDLDMVSATCPRCNILLVEAQSPTFANLGTAENAAAAAKPVSIGNSYGGSESTSETSYDSYYSHPGIAITAATGDAGYGVSYPASSPDVIAVGGTTLSPASGSSRGWSETAWSGAGSGCSAVERQPTWQAGLSNITGVCANRAVADVAAVADPNTGVAVYDTYGLRGWTVFGGTSVSAQIIAGVYALAGGLGGATAASGLYAAAPGDLFDVASGSNGSCGSALCTAGVGWDGPTGLGSPDGIGAF
jgi:subtilase family serine protease